MNQPIQHASEFVNTVKMQRQNSHFVNTIEIDSNKDFKSEISKKNYKNINDLKRGCKVYLTLNLKLVY